jgi:hypothetical protein
MGNKCRNLSLARQGRRQEWNMDKSANRRRSLYAALGAFLCGLGFGVAPTIVPFAVRLISCLARQQKPRRSGVSRQRPPICCREKSAHRVGRPRVTGGQIPGEPPGRVDGRKRDPLGSDPGDAHGIGITDAPLIGCTVASRKRAPAPRLPIPSSAPRRARVTSSRRHRITSVPIRFGTWPTGTFATTFIARVSMTDTELIAELVT